MKASRFNFVTTYPRTGESLLFNTLTGAFCAVDEGASERTRQLLASPSLASEEPDLAADLHRQGFLVDDTIDEHAIVFERSTLGIRDNNRLDVIVMPNMNCNLACTYCYERHEISAMTEDTTARLLTWLRTMVPRFKVVLISWFGGEPLLSYDVLLRIQREVRQLCSTNAIVFSSHITTNGYLLSSERASELISLGLYSYQITLDGSSDVHDSMRPLRGGQPSFHRIMDNICSLVRSHPRAHVKLRVNYDDRNIKRIPQLLDLFPDDLRPRLDVVYERIFGEEYSKFVDPMPRQEVARTVEEMYEYAAQLGFGTSMRTTAPGKLTYCYADRRNQVLINYNGDVFKCTVDKFKPKNRLGYLLPNGSLAWDDSRLAAWHSIPTFEEKCFACTFMPMCMGGCRKLRGREGTVGDDCKLPFAAFDVRLQTRYAQHLGDDFVAHPEASSCQACACRATDTVDLRRD